MSLKKWRVRGSLRMCIYGRRTLKPTGALQVVRFADGRSDGLSDRHNDGKCGRYLLQFSPCKKRLLADEAKIKNEVI